MFEKYSTFIREHLYECCIIAVVSVVILDVLFLIYIGVALSSEPTTPPDSTPECLAPTAAEAKVEDKKVTSGVITIDVSGAVDNPGAYEVSSSARLSHVLKLAGGLSESADKDFFARNYNISSRLSDEQKIYVPRKDELESGIFIEDAYTIDHTVCSYSDETAKVSHSEENSSTSGMSLNFATATELETLPGVGPATSKKIIDGRPYDSIDTLFDEKIVSQKVFDDIHERLKL